MNLTRANLFSKIVVLLTTFVLGCIFDFSNQCSAKNLKLLPKEQKQAVYKTFYSVLDVDKVIGQSVAYKEFKTRWSRVNEKYQKEIEFYESQLLELEKKITDGSPNKVDMVQAKQKIGTYEVKVQELLRRRKETLESAANKAIEILRKNVDKLVHSYAQRNKISIIFSKVQVIYFSEAVDITNFISNELNKRLQKLEVDIR
jgi:Skp family chaperone for outer membrane proteins